MSLNTSAPQFLHLQNGVMAAGLKTVHQQHTHHQNNSQPVAGTRYVSTAAAVSLPPHAPGGMGHSAELQLGGNQSGLDGNQPVGLTKLTYGAFLRARGREVRVQMPVGEMRKTKKGNENVFQICYFVAPYLPLSLWPPFLILVSRSPHQEGRWRCLFCRNSLSIL